ncbi:MAG: class E sortase [bacterium]
MRRVCGNILLLLGLFMLIYPFLGRLEAFSWQVSLEEPTITSDFKEGQVMREKPSVPVLDKAAEQATATIEIPRLKVSAMLVYGTSREQLKKGPGFYEESPLPYEEGANVLIAGHRTTYGAWFRHLDSLEAGDEISLYVGGKRYLYRVEKVFSVAKDDWSVTDPVGYSVLTLTTCHPPGSARERLVVRARLVRCQ